ncbi:MAG: hypothetical protein Q8876_10125, partial [Bacillota bacterium]|nr:hypothetical protein [Bacillota bacterium]
MKSGNTLWSYISKYRYKSVFFQYFTLTILCIAVPFMVYNFILYQSSSTILKNEIENASMHSMINLSSTLDILLTQPIKLSQNLLYYEDIQTFLTLEERQTEQKYFRLYKNVGQLLRDYVTNSDCIDSMYLYNRHQNYIISNLTAGDTT